MTLNSLGLRDNKSLEQMISQNGSRFVWKTKSLVSQCARGLSMLQRPHARYHGVVAIRERYGDAGR